MKTNTYLGLALAASLFATTAAHAQTYDFSILAGHAGKNPVFNSPHGVTVDASGNLYVTDTGNHVIRLISPQGAVSTFTNLCMANHSKGADDFSSFSFHSPMGIALDKNGNIYVSDNNVIYKVTGTPSNAVVTSVAGSTQGYQDGPGHKAKFNGAYGLCVDTSGNIWVADENNAEFREITTNGVVVTVAPIQISSAHLPGKLADNDRFTGIAFDHHNNLFLMDDTAYVHEFSIGTGFSTLWNGGNSTSSRGLAVDNDDNVYIHDGGSNCVLCVSSSGCKTLGTLPANHPQIAGVAADSFRNIYMVDTANNLIIKGTVSYPSFFDGQAALGGGIYYLTFTNGTPFGYYNLGSFNFPWFFHYDMGFEYFFDANDGNGGAYLYDSTSEDFWYTSPSLFPFMYDFTLDAWLYYYPDTNNPGHYTSNPRYFYNFGAHQIITR